MTTKRLGVFTPLLVLCTGCNLPEIDEDTIDQLITGRAKKEIVEEYFIGLPAGTNTTAGPAIREALMGRITVAPSGTWFTFFDTDTHELICSYQIPDGSPALREDQAGKHLQQVFDRLDPELSGGSQDVDLIATPASVRKYRKTDLPPRVVLIGSPMVVDREGSGTVTPTEMPCDGSVLADEGCYTRMNSFPADTRLVFMSPTGSYGPGPNFRDAVENHLRLLINSKKGELIRVSSDAKLLFDFEGSQWDGNPVPADDCNGRKSMEPESEVKKFDPNGNEIVDLGGDLEVKNQRPATKVLKGPLNPVLFHIDTSGSVGFDAKGNPRPGPLNTIKRDAIEKLRTMEFARFAVLAYGGDADYQPVYQRFPRGLLGGSYWVEATTSNRERAIAFIEGLEAGGGTPTGPSLIEAMKLEGPFSCLSYSDGVPTLGDGGIQGCLDLTERLKERGIVINSIGIGSLAVDSEVFDAGGARFLAEMGLRTGGDYFALPEEAPGDGEGQP